MRRLAVALTLIFDPAEGSGSGSYEGGARFGEIFRYVLLGFIAGCSAQDRRLEETEAILRSGVQAPEWLVKVTERCAAEVAPPS